MDEPKKDVQPTTDTPTAPATPAKTPGSEEKIEGTHNK
jgi:hypothetical protein